MSDPITERLEKCVSVDNVDYTVTLCDGRINVSAWHGGSNHTSMSFPGTLDDFNSFLLEKPLCWFEIAKVMIDGRF